MSKKGIIYTPPDLSGIDAEISRINDEIDRLNTERAKASERRGDALEGAFEALPELPATISRRRNYKGVTVRLIRYTKASAWVSMSASEHGLDYPTRCSRKDGSEHGGSRRYNRIEITDLDALEAAIAAHERGEK